MSKANATNLPLEVFYHIAEWAALAEDTQYVLALAETCHTLCKIVLQVLNPRNGRERLNDAQLAAAHHGFLNVTKALLRHGKTNASVKTTPGHIYGGGMTPLLLAAKAGHKGMVHYLTRTDVMLRYGGNPDCRDALGISPLGYAALYGHMDVVNLLLATSRVPVANKAAKCKVGRIPLSYAAQGGRMAIAEVLLKRDPESLNTLDLQGHGPVSIAVIAGHTEMAERLLRRKDMLVNHENGGGTILHHAAEKGDARIVRVLSSNKRVDPNALDQSQETPLCRAARQGRKAAVQVLVASSRVDPECIDCNRRTPLSWAAGWDYPEVVEQLLARDVDPNARDNKGKTALSFTRTVKVAELLLARGADIEAKDHTGRTALSHAAMKGRIEVLKLLLKRGAVADAKDDAMRTPFSYAAQFGELEIVKILLARKDVDSHMPCRLGRTPLVYAATSHLRMEGKQVMKFLLSEWNGDMGELEDMLVREMEFRAQMR